MLKSTIQKILLTLSIASLTACGGSSNSGGGGGQDTTPPVFTSVTTSVSSVENDLATGYTATATDVSTLEYSLTGGTDQAKFNIDGTTGVLTFIAKPDFEAPSSADGDNDYQIEVTASDGSNSAIQTVTITVTNADEAIPVITLNGGNSQTIFQGVSYTELNATAADDTDGDITSSIVVDSSSINTSVIANYTVTYNVSDDAGNQATEVTRTVSVVSHPLNDTGITWGGTHSSGNNDDCTGETIGEQDCSSGRDADANLTKIGAGDAGFDFTKLDVNGDVLDANATSWSCVKDNHTGLIWEVKTYDGLHSKDDRYNWYNTDDTTNGGADGSAGDTYDGCTGYEAGTASTFCNTKMFVARVNASNSGTGLCGATDWRLPDLSELQSIANLGKANPDLAIDEDYFPNTKEKFYWSSTPYANGNNVARGIDFFYGKGGENLRSSDYYVRLVR